MPAYRYRATSLSGRIREGIEQAASNADVERILGERGLLVLELREAEAVVRGPRERRSRHSEVTEGVRYLATLLETGFTIDRALGTVRDILGRADVAQAFGRVRERVRGGATLAQAFSEQPKYFSRLAVGMVRAGERGGQLSDALGTLADQLEREQQLRADLTAALLYPAVLLLVGGVAVAILLLVVLPRFATLFAEVGAELPTSARILIAAGGFVARWWPFLLAGAAVLTAGLATVSRSDRGRLWLERSLRRLPLIGRLRRLIAGSRFGRTLGTLLGAGLPILQALEIAGDAVDDGITADEVRHARDAVRSGATLAAGLKGGDAFPPLFVQMLEVGEEAGRLQAMLARAAQVAEQDLRRGLDRGVRLVEPIMIIVFGIAAGGVALALLQTIYGFRIDVPR